MTTQAAGEFKINFEMIAKAIALLAACFSAYYALDARLSVVNSRVTTTEVKIEAITKELDENKEDRRRDMSSLNLRIDNLSEKMDKMYQVVLTGRRN